MLNSTSVSTASVISSFYARSALYHEAFGLNYHQSLRRLVLRAEMNQGRREGRLEAVNFPKLM